MGDGSACTPWIGSTLHAFSILRFSFYICYGVLCVRKMSHAEGAENAEVSGWLEGTEVQDRLGPFLPTDVMDCTDGRLRFLPRNAQKPASRDAEGSLKNFPLDSILAILLRVKKCRSSRTVADNVL